MNTVIMTASFMSPTSVTKMWAALYRFGVPELLLLSSPGKIHAMGKLQLAVNKSLGCIKERATSKYDIDTTLL